MCKVGYYSTLEVVGYPVQSPHVPFHHLMLRVHMYVILSCMYRILCRRLTEYLLVMSERALETVIGAFAVTRSAEDISDGYRITLPWILMRSSWKRLYPRGAVMPRKRVAAFSVYKRQQLRDEEDVRTLTRVLMSLMHFLCTRVGSPGQQCH